MNETLLSPEVLAKLKRIQFRMRSLATDVFSGEYTSAFKGQGIEFEEVRPYQPGDEIRRIDWNVTARSGDPFVKIFREERETTLFFLVDVSASMAFGTTEHRKSDIAAEVTALLTHTALKSHDRVGLILFSDRIERYIPAKKGRSHVWRVIREILSHRSHEGRTNLTLPLEFLNRVAKRRAVAFLISDFFGEKTDPFPMTLRRTARHHDLIAISVHDRREEVLPPVRWVELRDAETGSTKLVNTSDATLKARWSERRHREKTALDHLLQSSSIDTIFLDTEGNYVHPLIRFFRSRERRYR